MAKVQESVLVTRQVGENPKLKITSCYFHTVPDGDKNIGLENTDFALYVSAVPAEGALAWGTHCLVNGEGRPIAGAINFNPLYLKEWDLRNNQSSTNLASVHTAIHEITHALGFSRQFIENHFKDFKGGEQGKPFVDSVARGGAPVRRMTTQKLLAETRAWFNCPSASGAELQWSGEGHSGTEGSHWNRRMFFEDTMAPTSKGGSGGLSRFTLALLEDSGYYGANYDAAEKASWGKGAGCGFLEQKCNTVGGGLHQEWCNNTNTSKEHYTCSWDYRGFGECQLQRHGRTALPAHYQYFPDDPRLGGKKQWMEYCPPATSYRVWCSDRNRNATNKEVDLGNFWPGANTMAHSRCMEVSGLRRVGGGGRVSDAKGSGQRCVEMRCVGETQIQYRLGNGGNHTTPWMSCPADGSVVSQSAPAGWEGIITCPRAQVLCAFTAVNSLHNNGTTINPGVGSGADDADEGNTFNFFSNFFNTRKSLLKGTYWQYLGLVIGLVCGAIYLILLLSCFCCQMKKFRERQDMKKDDERQHHARQYAN